MPEFVSRSTVLYLGVGTLGAWAAFSMAASDSRDGAPGDAVLPPAFVLGDSAAAAEYSSRERTAAAAARVAQRPPTGRGAGATALQSSPGRGGGGAQQRGRFRNVNRYPGPIPTPDEWVPPDGPVRIALQAGHWKANEAPPELAGLRDNGTNGGGKAEWEVNLVIAETAAELLREKGYEVDILPAVVPPGYRSHLFIAIHADGAADTRASGYRVAGPRFDATGRAARMVTIMEESYGRATGLRKLPDVTRRMENYYAFNFRRFEHALHPMTIAIILETGFLTSPADRRLIVDDPRRVALGIVDAVLAFPETALPEGQPRNGGGGGY